MTEKEINNLIQLKSENPHITIEILENGGVSITGKGYPIKGMFKKLLTEKRIIKILKNHSDGRYIGIQDMLWEHNYKLVAKDILKKLYGNE